MTSIKDNQLFFFLFPFLLLHYWQPFIVVNSFFGHVESFYNLKSKLNYLIWIMISTYVDKFSNHHQMIWKNKDFCTTISTCVVLWTLSLLNSLKRFCIWQNKMCIKNETIFTADIALASNSQWKKEGKEEKKRKN